jgi:hypothetical protein
MFSSRTLRFSNRAIPAINEFEVTRLLLFCWTFYALGFAKLLTCVCCTTELMLKWLANNFGSPKEISASLVVAAHAWSGRFFVRTAAAPSARNDGDRFQLLSQETAVFFLMRIINCQIEDNLQAKAPPSAAAALSVVKKRPHAKDATMCTQPDAKKFRVGAYASPLATGGSLPAKPLENATHENAVPVVQEFDVVVAQQPNHPGNQKFQGTNKLSLRISLFVTPRFTYIVVVGLALELMFQYRDEYASLDPSMRGLVHEAIFDSIRSAGGRFVSYCETQKQLSVLNRGQAVATIQMVLQELISASSSLAAFAPRPCQSPQMTKEEGVAVCCHELDVVFGDDSRVGHAGNRRLEGTNVGPNAQESLYGDAKTNSLPVLHCCPAALLSKYGKKTQHVNIVVDETLTMGRFLHFLQGRYYVLSRKEAIGKVHDLLGLMKSLNEWQKSTSRGNAGPQNHYDNAPLPALQNPPALRTNTGTNGPVQPAERSTTAVSQGMNVKSCNNNGTSAKPSNDSMSNFSQLRKAIASSLRRTVHLEPEAIAISDHAHGSSSAHYKCIPAAPAKVAYKSTEESLSSIPISLEEYSTHDDDDDDASAHERYMLNAAEFESPNGHSHETTDSDDSPSFKFHDILNEATDLVLGPHR